MSEKFDPFKYKSLEEMEQESPEKAEKYTKEGQGFVLKETEENYERAEKLAELAGLVHKGKKVEAIGILQEEAQQLYEKLEEIKNRERIPRELRNDKEVVLEAVKQYGWALSYASKELRNDKEVVLEAVKKDGRALEYASKELQNDKEVVLEVVKKDGWTLEFTSKELQNDLDVVLTAVKQNRSVIQYASVSIQEKLGRRA